MSGYLVCILMFDLVLFPQPLLEEYQEYGPILEDVNDAGYAFDATQSEGTRPQSPFRRMISKLLLQSLDVS